MNTINLWRIEVLKVIAHPIRIQILEELRKGVKCVGEFEDFLKISQPNVSQHFSLLRHHGIIDYYLDGRLRCYYLVDPIIPELLDLLKKAYSESLPAPHCCPKDRFDKNHKTGNHTNNKLTKSRSLS